MRGTVYKSTGSWHTVKAAQGPFYQCRIKGKFRQKGIKSTNPIVVGDHVTFNIETVGDETIGVITEIEERKNHIVRKSVNLSKQTHIIAANLDQAFLLVTLKNPTTFPSFIDRFLVTAEAYKIPVVLLFNKIDLCSPEERIEVNYWAQLYEKIGYPCIKISAETGTNINLVKDAMRHKTSVFSGHSGTGKSTLINALEPGLTLKTGKMSEQHRQGQHTTTFAAMYDLSFEARIIDTPGIKGFGIVDMEQQEIGNYFPEFFRLKTHCKFHNCLHLEEPHCAVKAALENNTLAWSRYRSYVQMITGEDENYRIDPHKDRR